MNDYSKVNLIRKSVALWPMHIRKEQETNRVVACQLEMIPEFPWKRYLCFSSANPIHYKTPRCESVIPRENTPLPSSSSTIARSRRFTWTELLRITSEVGSVQYVRAKRIWTRNSNMPRLYYWVGSTWCRPEPIILTSECPVRTNTRKYFLFKA